MDREGDHFYTTGPNHFFPREPTMFGPGDYVPDSTEGIVDVKDLPVPPGPFSFRKEVAKQAQNELKGFVPRGASLSRHAPMTQNPFMETDAHDTTAPSAHRGL